MLNIDILGLGLGVGWEFIFHVKKTEKSCTSRVPDQDLSWTKIPVTGPEAPLLLHPWP